MLLYSPEKKAYIGFIPNDQAGFVDRIRKVIQQQKNKQGQGPPGPVGPAGGPAGPIAPNQPNAAPFGTPQTPGQNVLVSQTNAMSMAGGQLSAPPLQQQQQQQQPPQQIASNQAGPVMAPTGIAPVRGVAPVISIEAERQQNLMTIEKLKQTLEAAQQKERQLQVTTGQPIRLTR